MKRIVRLFFLIIYYGIVQFLPGTTFPLIGNIIRKLRGFTCQFIFQKTGRNINVERKAYFGNGHHLQIGDNSGVGPNCHIPNNVIIGKDVMMAPNVTILNVNHPFKRTDIPMRLQKSTEKSQLNIGDDVWIGRNTIILPSVTQIGTGSIIGAGAVVTKNVEEFSIVGGNPARKIKSRLI